jgi:ribosomal protein L37AE/L43A
MKKSVILLIALACIFIASCGVMDSVSYCPYCSSYNISKEDDGIYKCNNSNCGKTFGAKEINAKEEA